MLSFLFALAVLATSSLAFPRNGDSYLPHIAGGDEVKPHSIPYQVALFQKREHTALFYCGGSLIAPRWVLTAAHCVLGDTYKTEVRMGVHNISKTETTEWKTIAEETFIHDSYDRKLNLHDIALLKLSDSAPIDGETINTIRLPKISQRGSSFVWSKATISGWGHLRNQYSPSSPVLRSVDTRIMWGPYCKFYFWAGKRRTYFDGDLHLCTSGWGKKGGCFGDSGGPLTIEESDGQKTLVGISDFIYDLNCESGGPTAFTRVSEHLDWIQNITDVTLQK